VEPPEVTFTVERFVVEGDNPLDAATTEQTLAPFAGEYSGLDGLLAVSDSLERELQARGFQFHRVVLPPQTLDGGVVRLNVVEFALAEVKIAGNKYFSAANVRASVPPLKTGQVPNTRALSRALNVANQHPRKQVRINFANSETTADALDARIQVREERPWQLFTALNNIGTDDTGNTRLSVGAQYANVFRRDHVLTGTVTTSPDNADDVLQVGVNYQLPIYRWSTWLSAFYVTSDVDIGNVQGFFDVSGAGDFIGFSGRRELLRFGPYQHGIGFGLQDRRFDTQLFNTDTGESLPGISTVVRSRPFNLRYDGSYSWTRTYLNFYIDLVKNFPWGGHNRDLEYELVRPGAEPEWAAVRFGTTVSRELPRGWLGVANMEGQFANEPLIPGEQFGLGGERSIRGYEERTVAGDDALQLNVEVWTPPVALLGGTRFLGFVDVGHKHLEDPQDPQRRSDTLSGAGVGARWQWKNDLIVAVDYGHTIAKAGGEASDSGNVKWHFNVQYRF
jgi:hemolysin activation/secretion protein